MLTPVHTYVALLIVQAGHLLHHRLAKRHISFAEFVSAVVLCFPPLIVALPSIVFMSAHLLLIAVQIVGSIWIRKLSPAWS
jgi:membrane protein YqaA with SNARE-associated domain